MFFSTFLAVLVLVTILFVPAVCIWSLLSGHDFLSLIQYLVYGCVIVADVHFVCQLLFPSALNFQVPRGRIIETWKLTKPFSLAFKPSLRFTSLVFSFGFVLLLVVTLLFTPIYLAPGISVGDCFQVAQHILYGCIFVLDVHFVLQLLFPNATTSGAFYECASKISLAASLSLFSLESALALFKSICLVCVVCVRGYIALATLGMNLLSLMPLILLRVFDRLFTPRPVLPIALAAAQTNKTSKKRNVHARPVRSYLVGGARRVRLPRPAKKPEHFVTPPEGPSTPSTRDTKYDSLTKPPQSPVASLPDLSTSSTLDSMHRPATPGSNSGSPRPIPPATSSSIRGLASFINAFLDAPVKYELVPKSESPQSPVASLPALSTSSTLDSLHRPATPGGDSGSPRPIPPAAFSSIHGLSAFINAFLDAPVKSELVSKSEPPPQVVRADDDISALVNKLEGFKLDLESGAPIEIKRPTARPSIVCKVFTPPTNLGPVVVPQTTLSAAGWENAIIEAWFLAVVAPGNFHDIYERNLKMLKAGHVAGRFVRC
ncbi:hypothetical protein FRC10_004095 [Ceratobasidium sp. 414]|nr:hypothetical protein FRC10_004095 [Ceratobasidium sp. 414]